MTNYEHLVETNQVDKLLNAIICGSPTEVAQEYGIKRNPVCRPLSEDVTEWLQAEYKEPPSYYIKVEDLISVLGKSGRTIQDYTCSMNSSSVSYVTVDQILSNLHLYTKDTIENECSSK